MILRLQSVEELELLQSRIKAKSTSIKVHENELRTNTGTDPEKGVDYDARAKAYNPITGVASVKNTPRTLQDHRQSISRGLLPSHYPQVLKRQCRQAGLPEPILEHMFHPTRKWRFDCAWHQSKTAVEINGGVWAQGRHTRGSGYIKDMEKRNEANRLGWRVFEFTPNQVKTRYALEYLKKVLA